MLIHRLRHSLHRDLLRLRQDRRGVSAVEFALIAPIMITIFYGLTEISTAIITQRRVSHSNSEVGDLIAQFSTVQTGDVGNALNAPPLIMAPYSAAPLQIRMTSVVVDSNGTARVNWSCVPSSQSSQPAMTAAIAPTTTPPAGMLTTTAGDSAIISETWYRYNSSLHYYFKSPINFNNVFYFKPRGSTTQVTFVAPASSPNSSLTWDSSSKSVAVTNSSVTCNYQSG